MKEYIDRDTLTTTFNNIDWYSINKKGELILGAPDGDTALFKACDIFKALREIRATDITPVTHGEWIEIMYCEDIAYATCNHCHSRGKVRTNRSEWGIWYIDSPYCPKCGTKMNGGK